MFCGAFLNSSPSSPDAAANKTWLTANLIDEQGEWDANIQVYLPQTHNCTKLCKDGRTVFASRGRREQSDCSTLHMLPPAALEGGMKMSPKFRLSNMETDP